jgi:hypothetical protein
MPILFYIIDLIALVHLANAQVQRSVDELHRLRLDFNQSQHLQQTLTRPYMSTAVTAYINGEAVLRKERRQSNEFVDEGLGIIYIRM